MTQSAAYRHARPTVYLMGFSCLPGDREYLEAQRATGSATPYWFQERLVYGDLRAKPHKQAATAAESKSDMLDVRVREEKDKPAKEKAQENLGTAQGQGKGKSGIKEMKTKERKGRVEKRKANESKEKRAPNPKRNNSPSKRTKTVPLPGKRVRFAWSIAVKTKRRDSQASRAKQVHKQSFADGTKPNSKQSNSSDKAAVNTVVGELTENFYLLDRFPSPPRSLQTTTSTSDATVTQQAHEQEQEDQGQKEKQAVPPPPPPSPQSQIGSRTLTQPQQGADRYKVGNHTLEQTEPSVPGAQKERNTSIWTTCLGFCFGKRK